MLMAAGPSSNRRLIQMMPLLRPPAGMAEVVKGAGLKIRSHMGSWVRIPLPAPSCKTHDRTRVTFE